MKVNNTNGFRAEFDQQKIIDSLMKETGMTVSQAGVVAQAVAHDIRLMYSEGTIKNVTGSLIREWVCQKLLDWGMQEQHDKYVRVGMPIYDAIKIDYGSGFENKENANLRNIPETCFKKKSDRLSKEQYLHMLPSHIADKNTEGIIHIHDLDRFQLPFCRSHDIRYFFYYGLRPLGNSGDVTVAGPAKHADVAIQQCAKVLQISQGSCQGGQGILFFNVFLSPYLKGKSYEEIKQHMQTFIFECNQTMASRGGQTVFSSINITPGVPTQFRDVPVVMAGKIWNGVHAPRKVYGDFEREVRLSFKALMDISTEGDYEHKMFAYPKLEIMIKREFVEDKTWSTPLIYEYPPNPEDITGGYYEAAPSYKELYRMAFALASKFGIPYFDNLLPSYRDSENKIECQQCCAFNFSCDIGDNSKGKDALMFKDGKHFAMGGIQVVSLNLPGAAYLADHDDSKLIAEVKLLMDLAAETFLIKKDMMYKRMPQLGFFTQTPPDPNTGLPGEPYTNFDDMVYEIAIVGLDDMVKYHTGYCLHESKAAVKIGMRLMTEMAFYAKELSEKCGINIVTSRSPAESTAQTMAVADLIGDNHDKAITVMHGDIKTAIQNLDVTKDAPVYYTNGLAPYVGLDIDIMTRLNIEGMFFPVVEGGNITHIWMSDKGADVDALMDFALKICKNTQIGYFTFTRDLTQCNDCHTITGGIKDKCSECSSQNVISYSRVTGYISSVNNWNAAKVQELEDRKRVVI